VKLHLSPLGCSMATSAKDGTIMCLEGQGCKKRKVSTAVLGAFEQETMSMLTDTDDAGNSEKTKKVTMKNKTLVIPQLLGTHCHPRELENRFIDSPHPSSLMTPICTWKGTSKTNPWWIVFHEMEDDEFEKHERFHCNVCATRVNVSKKLSGELLARHIFRHHRAVYKMVCSSFGRSVEDPEKAWEGQLKIPKRQKQNLLVKQQNRRTYFDLLGRPGNKKLQSYESKPANNVCITLPYW
jgi:hypothetical protein